MKKQEITTAQYESLSLDARKALALSDQSAARAMALSDLLILSTARGRQLLEGHAQRDLATVQDMKLAIGASNAADPDWKENTELLGLKLNVPVYVAVYAKTRRDVERTLVYHEESSQALGFGGIFQAQIVYPDRDEAVQRRYALLGPNEVSHGDRYYVHPASGEKYMIISYMAQLGRAIWGASPDDVQASPHTFPIPNSTLPAQIIGLDLLGSVAE